MEAGPAQNANPGWLRSPIPGRAWLTTVVGRICLDMLRARKARREDYPGTWLPEPLVAEQAEDGPEQQSVLADSVGLALLVVLESPDVVLRFDTGPDARTALPPLAALTGAQPVARFVASRAPRFVTLAKPVLVNGAAGVLFGTRRRPLSVLSFTVVGGRIAALDLVADPAKLRHLNIEP